MSLYFVSNCCSASLCGTLFCLAIFIVLPTGLIKVSTGLEEGCSGGMFFWSVALFSVNYFIADELKGGPLSESCVSGLP